MNTEIKKLKELTQDFRMVMLTTLNDEGNLNSRPMGAQQIDDEGNFWFFTSSETGKVASIESYPEVNLAYVNPSSGTYVSVCGTAEIVHDKTKAKELWSPMLKAWFPEGVDQSDLVLIKIPVASAEFWDAPNGKMIQLLGMAKAALRGQRYEASKGEHGKLNTNTRH